LVVIRIFELYEIQDKSDEFTTIKEIYSFAFALYQKGSFDKALKKFNEINKDGPSKLMIDRIKHLVEAQKNGNLGDWGGVWKWAKK